MNSFPESFRNLIQHLIADDTEIFFKALSLPAPTSIRINPNKKTEVSIEEKVPWCSTGFYLKERPVFTLDPLFHAGTYYVQEASSMFLEQIIKQLELDKKEIRALDLCAAPGGKSTHLLSLLTPDSLLVSNEVIRSRVNVLEENIIKWGSSNCFITNNEAKDFTALENYFDLIVCDAPCSGEGLFRKDTDAVKHWSEEAVLFCSQRQKKIIADVLPALKPGGYFIYCTCTFNKTENENVVEWMQNVFGLNAIEMETNYFPGIVKDEKYKTLRFYPHKIKGEGFSISVLQKPMSDYKELRSHHLKLKETKIENVLLDNTDFIFVEDQQYITALRKSQVKDFAIFKSKLNVIEAGIKVFEIKGTDKIPVHQLAMSTHLNKNYFPAIELKKQDALRYLKGETNFKLEGNDGIYLVTYSKQPLGFLKKIKHRNNNLYPRNRFIRMRID